jgi:chromosomal replication initiator protein
MQTFRSWLATPGNRQALFAVRRVMRSVCEGRKVKGVNPLFLHGSAGTGKTHLVNALAAETTKQRPDSTVSLVPATEWELLFTDSTSRRGNRGSEPSGVADALALLEGDRHCDVLIIEDLQRLSGKCAEALAMLMDRRLARQRQMVFTAHAGPAQLEALPARLASRLACGLVVGLRPFGVSERLAFLRRSAARRGLAVPPDLLEWVAQQLDGSGRQLEGALHRLESLVRAGNGTLDRKSFEEQFLGETASKRLTVDEIARRVGAYFQLPARELQSRRRSRLLLRARQVGMYLARQLTGLPLKRIGAYFGGRDHSTVLHACHKIEQELHRDHALSGAVRQLQAELE